MFKEVPRANFVRLEEEVLKFWQQKEVFKKSLTKDAPKGNYVFYEGPPTANGKPGIHHVLSRAFKDLFPRFKTMQGYKVVRKGGWDTHGLPVEIAIEKRLGFTKKTQIDEYGIDKFNSLAKRWVFENIQDWNYMTERMGYWIDLEDPYITYNNEYIESCWWVMKELWQRGLLGEDYKTTWHCPRNNTSLASHEVSLGYKENVPDPSIYPKFPANMEALAAKGIITDSSRQAYLLAWTTTPWTLAANTALAVSAEADYGLFEAPRTTDEDNQDLYIMLASLGNNAFGEGKHKLIKTFKGSELIGIKYQPILRAHVPSDEDLTKGYRVIADEHVTTDSGTGVLHVAPAYGDLEIGKTHYLPTIFSVDLLGEVYPEVRPMDLPVGGEGPYAKKFFKDADKEIARDLLDRGLLYRQDTIYHTYPFNWRDGTPLINYAKKSWYIRTSKLKDRLVSNNQAINWVPEHIRDGRFGKWLENNIDWALSRERYWGCPLPIWISEDSSENHCIGSIKELAELSGQDLSDLELHRPYVDAITFEKNGKLFKRLPYTVDVWFESGAMPYAQWHYMGTESTFEEKQSLEANFPADYICEAIDQTRGWFYSLHALATLLTYDGDDEIPAGPLVTLATNQSSFKNVICLGHILDEKGEKMSKSKGNIVDPEIVLNKQGADALRWYLYSSAPPGSSRRFSENLVDETIRDFFNTLWESYKFFVLYANLDKPALKQNLVVSERPEIDRWLIAKVNHLTKEVTEVLENYDPTLASRLCRDFVVDNLSNWYIRRNRRRFWKSESDIDKLAAYKTLYETLVTIAKLIAPMAPFVSESLYQNLVLSLDETSAESVHLSQWPEYDDALIDEDLLRDMNALVQVIELGRSARAASKVKMRQPLPEALIRVRSQAELSGLKRLEGQILEELNVKAVKYLDIAAEFVSYKIKPNLPLVGKRLGKLIPELKKKLAEVDGRVIAANVREGKETVIELVGERYSFEPEDFLLEPQSPEGYVAAEEGGYLAALNITLTPELLAEGLARDVIRVVQNARKNADLEVSDHIRLGLNTEGRLKEAVIIHQNTIAHEVLAKELQMGKIKESYFESIELEGQRLEITIRKVEQK